MWLDCDKEPSRRHIAEGVAGRGNRAGDRHPRPKLPVAFAWFSKSDMARPQCQPGLVRGRDGRRGGGRRGEEGGAGLMAVGSCICAAVLKAQQSKPATGPPTWS